jgi:hypothetical protein
MGLVAPFHAYGDTGGEKLVYHNQSECPDGQELVRNGSIVSDDTSARTLCARCSEIAEGRE